MTPAAVVRSPNPWKSLKRVCSYIRYIYYKVWCVKAKNKNTKTNIKRLNINGGRDSFTQQWNTDGRAGAGFPAPYGKDWNLHERGDTVTRGSLGGRGNGSKGRERERERERVRVPLLSLSISLCLSVWIVLISVSRKRRHSAGLSRLCERSERSKDGGGCLKRA